MKSQISMLEKKVHENWVTARQTERKLEDAKQEAAQLRNRLTLRERAINEERIQNSKYYFVKFDIKLIAPIQTKFHVEKNQYCYKSSHC